MYNVDVFHENGRILSVGEIANVFNQLAKSGYADHFVALVEDYDQQAITGCRRLIIERDFNNGSLLETYSNGVPLNFEGIHNNVVVVKLRNF